MGVDLKRAFKSVMERLGYSPKPQISPACSNSHNNRISNRKRQQLLDGFIVSEKMIKPRPCSVRDMNHFGSRVDLWDEIAPGKIADGLTLYIPCDGKEVDCEIAWVRGKSLGVRFHGRFRDPTRRYS